MGSTAQEPGPGASSSAAVNAYVGQALVPLESVRARVPACSRVDHVGHVVGANWIAALKFVKQFARIQIIRSSIPGQVFVLAMVERIHWVLTLIESIRKLMILYLASAHPLAVSFYRA